MLQYNPIQAFTVAFISYVQLYRPCHKTAHTALQALFQRFAPFCRRIYQTDTNGYNTTCAMLEHITVLQHLQRIPKTSATPDAVQVNTAAYYNKVYIRVRPYYGSMPAGAAYRRLCQPGEAVQRRAARNHWRLSPHLFSGFRPIANRGQQ